MTATLAGTGIMPTLTVNDLQQSLQFFAALGFEVEDRWEHDGVLLGAMLRAGQVPIGLSLDDGKKGRDRVKGAGVRLYIETTDDINALAARAKDAGLTLVKEPFDTDWGTRAFEIVEPSGFAITFTSKSGS